MSSQEIFELLWVCFLLLLFSSVEGRPKSLSEAPCHPFQRGDRDLFIKSFSLSVGKVGRRDKDEKVPGLYLFSGMNSSHNSASVLEDEKDAFDLLPESEPGKKNSKRYCWAVLVQRDRGSKVICGLSDVVACEARFLCGSRW